MWMHNGNIGAWRHIKRRLASSLNDKWFLGVQGSTDSEWAFALFLDTLEKSGTDPDDVNGQRRGFGHKVLRMTLLRVIEKINSWIQEVEGEGRDEEDARSLLNFAVSDGHSVVCTRYVSSKTDEGASLYFSSGSAWKEGPRKGDFVMERRDQGADIVIVASEPLTFERGASLSFCFRRRRRYR